MGSYAYEVHVYTDDRTVYQTNDIFEALRFASGCEEESFCFDLLNGYSGEVLWSSKDGKDLYITEGMRLVYLGFKLLEG